MASPRYVSCSRTYPVPLAEAYQRTIAWPLEDLFDSRYGPIPPITGTEQDDDGVWGSHVDQVRTIHLGDGGSMRERLTVVDPPNQFAYRITDITGPMKGLADHIDGTWAFEAVGSGSRITWSWTIHPKSSVSALALPAFGAIWKGSARRTLDHLEGLLLQPAA